MSNEDIAPPQPRSLNFILLHWRGDLPLAVSYWVVGIVCGIVLLLTAPLVVHLFRLSGIGRFSVLALITTLWLVITVVTIWQLVGVWRSAGKYIARKHAMEKSAPWGMLARAAVVIGVIQFAVLAVGTGIPQFREVADIAFLNDTSLPPYAIRPLRNGQEVEISGGIKFGLADDLRKFLDRNRNVQVVHLDSVGGRIGEGKKLYDLIREKRLMTYVSSGCASACTLAFAAGRERVLRSGGVLGFHRGQFAGQDGDDDEQRGVFVRAGFPADFINRAMATQHSDLWRPTADELVRAGVVTRVTPGEEYAVSGFGLAPTRESLSNLLLRVNAPYAATKELYPDVFAELLDIFFEAVDKGSSFGDMRAASRAKFRPFLDGLVRFADDDVLLDYARVQADEYEAVGKINATACQEYYSKKSIEGFAKLMPAALIAREQPIAARVIRTAAKQREIVPHTQAAWDRFRTAMQRKGFHDGELVWIIRRDVAVASHPRFCAMLVAFIRTTVDMPTSDAVSLLRQFYKS
jgi:hypothetical protein